MTRIRRRRERGAAFLEFALVFLPWMAMLIAIIDFTIPIFIEGAFNHAAREGARYGITFPNITGLSQSDAIKQKVQLNSFGFLTGTTGLSKIQVKYYSPETFLEMTGAGANDDGHVLEVSIVGYTWGWIAPIWRPATPLTVNAISCDRLETLPRSVVRPAP